jgi:hypothetical protein
MDRDDYIPLGDMRLRKVSQWRLTRKGAPTFVTVALAALVGLLVGYSISSYTLRPDYGRVTQLPPPLSQPIAAPTVDPHDSDYLDLEALGQMVARSKGYWARDYSLHLGWNNVSATVDLQP